MGETVWPVELEILAQPHGAAVGDRLIAELRSDKWDRFRCVVAFAKISGVRHLDSPLRAFVDSGGEASVAVGVDHGGTSFEAASQLAGAVDNGGRLIIAKDIGSNHATFHPKIYAFTKGPKALIVVGSSNITEGGLFTNYELSTAIGLDSGDPADAGLHSMTMSTLDLWQDTSSGLAAVGDEQGLLQFHDSGLLPSEEQIAAVGVRQPLPGAPPSSRDTAPAGLSKKTPRPRAPKRSRAMGPPLVSLPPGKGSPSFSRPPSGGSHDAFFIDIFRTKKTEIYLSKGALTEDPVFFGHPFSGRTKPRGTNNVGQPERKPRPIVDIQLIDSAGNADPRYRYLNHELKLWEYAEGPNKKGELRATVPKPLNESLPDGCILEMRRRPVRDGIDYSLDFLTPGSTRWKLARGLAVEPLPNSKRKKGWG